MPDDVIVETEFGIGLTSSPSSIFIVCRVFRLPRRTELATED